MAVNGIDSINAKLLQELQEDARTSVAELGRRVGLSAPAVAERLQRLEAEGVIRGYRTEVDPRALGYSLSAVMRIRPAPRQLPKVAELARKTPEIVECHRVTGEDCFYMRLHVRSIEELEELIDRFLIYGTTTTSIVQSSPVQPRALPTRA
jgi:Lrp/AsnC family leucine-responsive transcriptional regulator